MGLRGQSGASLGGNVVRTRQRKLQRNSSPCPTCGAGKGSPCFDNTPGGGLKKLSRTHRAPAAPQRSAGSRKSANKTVRSARQAYQKADELGPIIPVRPTRLRMDRSPRLGPGQVYVMRSGAVYHPAWCSIVAAKWDSDPEGLLLIADDTVGGRRECKACEEPLTD